MKYVLGVLMVGWGIFVLARHKRAAASGAKFHQRIAKAFPPYAFSNPNVSEEARRYMAPAIGVFMIAGGVAILVFVPS
jgi:hypothetical protein